jgi:hypothetical protein
MPRQKSIYTVKQATQMAYKAMPQIFQSQELVQMARSIMARPSCMDGTILRRLREMRENNPVNFNYEIIDNNRSIYRKKEQKLSPSMPKKPMQASLL